MWDVIVECDVARAGSCFARAVVVQILTYLANLKRAS